MALAIYARVSTEEQRERQPIRAQIYSDDGVSGAIPLERPPEGSQILKDARHGRFDRLLICKLDRLERETRLILNAEAEIGLRLSRA